MLVYTPTQVTVPPHAIHGTQVTVTRDWLSPGQPVTKLKFIKRLPAADHKTTSPPQSSSADSDGVAADVTHRVVAASHGVGWESLGDMSNNFLRGNARTTPSVTITFGTNRYQVPAGQRVTLHRLSASGCWLAVGHADPRGSVAYNLNLSARRAIAVAAQLRHTRAVAVEAFGSLYAATRPEWWPKDRRVDVYRISCKGATK